MKNSESVNEHLLNDAMSTTSLDEFYTTVEQQIVSRMESSTPLPPPGGARNRWLGLGGGAAVLILAGAAIAYYASRTEMPEVATPMTMRPVPSVTTNAPSPQATEQSAQRSVPVPTQPHSIASTSQGTGSTSVGRVTAEARPTSTMSAQTQRDIDSLQSAMKNAAQPSDAARIQYQLGLRYRIAGDNTRALDHLVASSSTAQKVGALTLAAKGRQQAAKAALDLGQRAQALSMYEQALSILPATESDLRSRWQHEIDSIRR